MKRTMTLALTVLAGVALCAGFAGAAQAEYTIQTKDKKFSKEWIVVYAPGAESAAALDAWNHAPAGQSCLIWSPGGAISRLNTVCGWLDKAKKVNHFGAWANYDYELNYAHSGGCMVVIMRAKRGNILGRWGYGGWKISVGSAWGGGPRGFGPWDRLYVATAGRGEYIEPQTDNYPSGHRIYCYDARDNQQNAVQTG